MTKGALNTFMLQLAAALGPRGITANTLALGFIATDANADYLRDPANEERVAGQTALGRIGQGGDVAEIAAFLASPASGWVTGQFIEASCRYRL